ncbi:SDR family NAD(P)-dependent oxidoreductase [Umboniibacter marinipuniceus]|uniref:NADP-dependent 3-hydroxy acid dehydrogenase YdfG n=1 Tax=Umboniibacter marinipuniceus TaxID=569599 RepID=A0A3M0AG02_9GAMM|nr:SDR family NAD(P)-dependent oxidoreductase [Umboniibacter marinipuniceus]RMA82529.1 NADP-dependent 3-hydroxy acid dehydrogenase YdfG [Umboniibacter marinipuniceus]
MNSFENRVIAVTGAASGIGRALSLKLTQLGAKIAAADLNDQGLADLKAEISGLGGECFCFNLDVSQQADFAEFAAATEAHFGQVDGIINNAGVTLVSAVRDMKRSDFEWLMNINFWGVVNGCDAFLPYLRKSDDAHIVNISSLFGLLALPLQSAYNASKFAVRGYTEALKMEMAGTPINVSAVHPGGIKTAIAKNSRVNEASLKNGKAALLKDFEKAAITTAEDAADIIIGGMLKNKRRIIVGKDARWMDRFVRWFPGSYEKLFGFEKGVLARRKREAKDQE